MTTQCVVRAAECNSPWRGKCPKDKRGPSPARGTSYSETPDIPSGTYCLIKYGLYVIPPGFEVKVFPHPPLRKSFVCDDSRNIIYAKHNIICRKATSFSDRKRKRYLRLWRKMVFLPAVGNTTLRVVVPLPPREGRRIPKQFRSLYSFSSRVALLFSDH